MTFNQNVKPICLPSCSNSYDNVQAMVTGWGEFEYEGAEPTILQKVKLVLIIKNYYVNVLNYSKADVETMSNSVCLNKFANYPKINYISSNMICAANAGGKNACGGDSGGPLITNEGSFYSLIGNNKNQSSCGIRLFC